MDLLFGMAVSVLLETVKNPSKRLALKRAFVKVYRAIGLAYASDREFWDLVDQGAVK